MICLQNGDLNDFRGKLGLGLRIKIINPRVKHTRIFAIVICIILVNEKSDFVIKN